jgi:hypothetical protein
MRGGSALARPPRRSRRRAVGPLAASTAAPPDDDEPSFQRVKDHDRAAPADRAGADEPVGAERPELEGRPAAGAARGRRVGPARARRGAVAPRAGHLGAGASIPGPSVTPFAAPVHPGWMAVDPARRHVGRSPSLPGARPNILNTSLARGVLRVLKVLRRSTCPSSGRASTNGCTIRPLPRPSRSPASARWGPRAARPSRRSHRRPLPHRRDDPEAVRQIGAGCSTPRRAPFPRWRAGRDRAGPCRSPHRGAPTTGTDHAELAP